MSFVVKVYAVGNLFLGGKDERERERIRAWFITTFCSSVTTLVGIFFTLQTVGLLNERWFDVYLSRALCIFFFSYCITDIAVAMVHYHNQMTIGYTHHMFYAGLLGYLLVTQQTHLFAICALEELPTIVLCLYRLTDQDLPTSWGPIFFVARVTYHLWIVFRAINLINPVIFFVSMLILVQHLRLFGTWFSNRVKESRQHGAAYALSLQTRLVLAGVALTLQVILHGWLVSQQVKTLFDSVESWSMFWLSLCGHITCFVYVVIEMLKIIQGVYEEHFILSAIHKW